MPRVKPTFSDANVVLALSVCAAVAAIAAGVKNGLKQTLSDAPTAVCLLCVVLWVCGAAIVFSRLRSARMYAKLQAFAKRHPERSRVVIVGGGFGGLGMATHFKEAGWRVEVFEKSDRVGGVWHHNRYPGCGCDIMSHLYSYSWFPNAGWTRRWPMRSEILGYIDCFVEEHGLEDCVRTNREVVSQHWDAAAQQWRVGFRDVRCLPGGPVKPGSQGPVQYVTAAFVVNGTGQLSRPSVPDFPGAGEFQGDVFHSTAWPRGDAAVAAVANKSVVVIGTGPTAVQLVPEVAKHCKQLTVVQRSPAWHVHKADAPFSKFSLWLFAHVPFVRNFIRGSIFVPADVLFWVMFKSRIGNWLISFVFRRNMRSMVKHNAELVKKITPSSAVGCKRVLISGQYLPTFLQSHVQLVCGGVRRFSRTGVVVYSEDGAETVIQADVVCLATGFKTQSWGAGIDVRGVDGATLDDVWGDEPAAFNGISVPGMPNFAFLYGPGTNLGHNSILYMLECQFNFIMKLQAQMVDAGVAAAAVKPEVCDAFAASLQRSVNNSAFNWGCKASWYRSKTGVLVNNWKGACIEYWLATLFPNLRRDYITHKLQQ